MLPLYNAAIKNLIFVVAALVVVVSASVTVLSSAASVVSTTGGEVVGAVDGRVTDVTEGGGLHDVPDHELPDRLESNR